MILNEVNGYCSIASDLVMVDIQASYVELFHRRMQIVYVVQFKTPQHVLNYRMIKIRGHLRTVDEGFLNWIGINKLFELNFLSDYTNVIYLPCRR